MASILGFPVSPFSAINPKNRVHFRAQAQNLDGGNSIVPDSVQVDGGASASPAVMRGQNGPIIEEGVRRLTSEVEEKMIRDDNDSEALAPLWDDGYGTVTAEDYFIAAKQIKKSDGGPPRWFCPVDCGRPLKNSPTLFFLPGLDGTGFGLCLHHKALGKVFEVRCLHIPVHDRTPFEELVKLVEEDVRLESALSPNKPIYLVGDSFGGCLALAVAARNPMIDLVLILVNPATSFGRSPLQPLFPILEALPNELHVTVPYLLSFVMGDPVKIASVNIENCIPPTKKVEKLSYNLTALLPCLPELADILPKDTLLWKLKLLKSAAAYSNSRLHAINAEVLVLASGKDNMLPSQDEAQRLMSSLRKCKVRCFKDSGHTFLLEDGVGLLTIIKGTCMYRRSRRHDLVTNFIPPSITELGYAFEGAAGILRSVTGSVMFSTLEDGKIVKGLAGVPHEGPVLFVGYHMLLGLELVSLTERFLSEKGIMLRGIAHPELFAPRIESSTKEFSATDWLKVFGGVSVSAIHLFRLLSTKSHVLLYPGGAREALHYKGEEYKLIWPDHQEFVRMAAKFGAKIVPFGAVGEDDIAEILLDYNDLVKIPMVEDYIKNSYRDSVKFRDEASGEVASQRLFFPVLSPKLPGRFYYIFGKPIKTKDGEKILQDKEKANQLYLQIKSEVERNLNYLIKKREEDPYRNVINRKLYQAIYDSEPPTFKP